MELGGKPNLGPFQLFIFLYSSFHLIDKSEMQGTFLPIISHQGSERIKLELQQAITIISR